MPKIEALIDDVKQRQGTPTLHREYPRGIGGGRWGQAVVSSMAGPALTTGYTDWTGGSLKSAGASAFGITGYDGSSGELTWDRSKSSFKGSHLMFEFNTLMDIFFSDIDFQFRVYVRFKPDNAAWQDGALLWAGEYYRGNVPGGTLARSVGGWQLMFISAAYQIIKFKVSAIGTVGFTFPAATFGSSGATWSITPVVSRCY